MDRDAEGILKHEVCFADGNHKRCPGYITLTLWVRINLWQFFLYIYQLQAYNNKSKKNAFPHPLKIKYNWALIRHAIWQGVKKKYADILARKCGKCVSYAKNTLDYAEISTADKIDNDIRTTVKRKALQSLTPKLSSSPTLICGICWQVFIHLHSFSRAFLTHFVYRIHCCVRGTSVA